VKQRLGISILTAALLCACQLSSAAEPAILTHVDAEVKQQLERFIVGIVGGTQVTLADNVLTEQSELFIDQRMPIDTQGRPLDGRHSLPSYRFVLVKVNATCILQHPASNKSLILQGVSCRTVASTNQ